MNDRPKLKVLDLFSGIGGFSLGLERTGGFETVAFCEIEPFPRRVLAKHWPGVPCYEDVRELTGTSLAADGITVDVICGGFPCQDISLAGDGAGLDGERSGLWSEYSRLICELRPKLVLVENVSALLGRGLDRVLGDLASFGYSVEWHCIPASALGAQHIRDRIWILAYTEHDWVQVGRGVVPTCEESDIGSGIHIDVAEGGEKQARSILAYAIHSRFQGAELLGVHRTEPGGRQERASWAAAERGSLPMWRDWAFEPGVGRVADGVPHRVQRIKALGNAVVPQIPELIGHAILASIRESEAA